MPNCAPFYSESQISHGPASPCSVTCAGVSFTLQTMKAVTGPNGACEFSWTVVRTRSDPQGNPVSTTSFSDEASFGCPGMQKVTFYCDAAKTCPGYELTLNCAQGSGLGGSVG